jgi:hypothetical protein
MAMTSNPSNPTKRLLIVIGGIVGVTAWSPMARGADVTLEQIHAAWRQRQDRVKSARFEWVEERLTPRARHGDDGARAYPPVDSVHTWKCTLLLDGQMVRYDWSGMQWNDAQKRFNQQSYCSASDTKVSKSFFQNHYGHLRDEPYPIGFIHVGGDNADVVGNSPLVIFLGAFRARDALLGFSAPLLNHKSLGTPTVSMKNIEGSRVAVIDERFEGGLRRLISIDPSSDFIIRNYEIWIREKLSTQLTIAHKRDEMVGWLPSSWTMQGWLPGPNSTRRLNYRIDGSLVHHEINPKIDVSQFRPEFAQGTIVRDARSDRDHLVKEDGEVRPILPAERARTATYEELATTSPGQAGLYHPGSWSALYWVGALAVVAAVLAVLWRLRNRYTYR